MNFLNGISVAKTNLKHAEDIDASSTRTTDSIHQGFAPSNSPPYDSSIPGVTVVCISDTHGKHAGINQIPHADVLIHAGDLTNTGTMSQISEFVSWLDCQPQEHKLFIAGNHDTSIDTEYYIDRGCARFHPKLVKDGVVDIAEYSEKCRQLVLTAKSTYLEDSSVYLSPVLNESRSAQLVQSLGLPTNTDIAVEAGVSDSINVATDISTTNASSIPSNPNAIHVYGSPWQPEFCDWAFNLERGKECIDKWNLIPSSTDILITHGPPYGYGDRTMNHMNCGCEDLMNIVFKRNSSSSSVGSDSSFSVPRVHVFGHIHENYGEFRVPFWFRMLYLTHPYRCYRLLE